MSSTASRDNLENCIKLRFAFEQHKVLAHQLHVEQVVQLTQQRFDIDEVLKSFWIIHQRLQLEADEIFGAGDLHCGIAEAHGRGTSQHVSAVSASCVEDVDAERAEQVVGEIRVLL